MVGAITLMDTEIHFKTVPITYSLVLPQSTVGNVCSIHSHKSTYFPFSSQTGLMTLDSAVTLCSQIAYSNVTNN